MDKKEYLKKALFRLPEIEKEYSDLVEDDSAREVLLIYSDAIGSVENIDPILVMNILLIGYITKTESDKYDIIKNSFPELE